MRDGVQNHLHWPKEDLCSKGVGNSSTEKVGLRKFCAPQSSISGERLLGIRSTAPSGGRRRRVSEAENKIICIGSHPHKSKRYICWIHWDGTRDRYSTLDKGIPFPLPLGNVPQLGTLENFTHCRKRHHSLAIDKTFAVCVGPSAAGPASP